MSGHVSSAVEPKGDDLSTLTNDLRKLRSKVRQDLKTWATLYAKPDKTKKTKPTKKKTIRK